MKRSHSDILVVYIDHFNISSSVHLPLNMSSRLNPQCKRLFLEFSAKKCRRKMNQASGSIQFFKYPVRPTDLPSSSIHLLSSCPNRSSITRKSMPWDIPDLFSSLRFLFASLIQLKYALAMHLKTPLIDFHLGIIARN